MTDDDDKKFIAAAKRIRAYVEGNGKNTIQELIDKLNQDPRRGYGHDNFLTVIKSGLLIRLMVAVKVPPK